MKKLLILLVLTSSLSHGKGVPYLKFFKESAAKYDVPVAALLAIAQITTNFNPDYSAIKLCGLMAVDATSTVFMDENIDCFDPRTNIDIGARWLRENMDYSKIETIEQGLKEYRYDSFTRKNLEKNPNPEFSKIVNAWDVNVIKYYEFYKIHTQ